MKDYQHISTLLEKYWESETTLEEESQLTDFFTQSEVPAEFQAFQFLFLAKAEATEPVLSKDFDLNILTMIAEENLMQSESKVVQMQPNNEKNEIRRLRWFAGIAASIALLLAAYIFIPKANEQNTIVEKKLTEEEKNQALKSYKQAKAALFFVSAKMNQGTQKAAEGMNKVKNFDKILNELDN